MGVYNHDTPPSADFLDMFLLTLYQGFLSGDEVSLESREPTMPLFNCVVPPGHRACDHQFVQSGFLPSLLAVLHLTFTSVHHRLL